MSELNGSDNRASDGFTANEFAGAGLQFAITLLVFVFAGAWLDKRLATGPLMILVGVAVGGAGGFYNLYRRIAAAQKLDDDERRARQSARPGS